MSKPPELWAFVIANTGLFVASGVLTALSYVAYRQSGGDSSYRAATVGFGFVVLGGLVEPVYQLGVKDGYSLNGNELLALQSGEGALITLGLGLLFWAIVNHGSESASVARANSEANSGFDDAPAGRRRPSQTWSERND